MKNIFKTNKRGIIAILTLCMLLNTIGICAYATAIPEDNMATPEDTTVVVEETAVATEEPIIVTEENIVVTEENTQELMPMMARACWGTLNEALNYYIGKNNWSYDENGSPQADGFNIYVSNGYCHVTGDDVNYSFYFG